MTSKAEQETTVTHDKAYGKVYIYTTNPVHLRKLLKDPRVRVKFHGDDYGEFETTDDVFDPLLGFKRKPRTLTPEQRQAAGERLRKARAAKHE